MYSKYNNQKHYWKSLKANFIMDKPQIILYAQKSVNYTVFDSKWIPFSAKFVTLGNHARGTGAIQIYELASGDVNLLKEVF